MKKALFTLVLVFFCSSISGQDTITYTNFTSQIRNYDLSVLWHPDAIMKTDDEEVVNAKRPEPLGYIGNDFQRFFIHFISVIKNKDNPYLYFIYGKTKVKNNICEFLGTITIKGAELHIYKEVQNLFPNYKQGTAWGEYTFYEKKTSSAGVFKGKVVSDFIINDKNEILYDAFWPVGDGYHNNQFEGTWQSYKTGNTKICNWGDFRIPNSQNLDGGTGEFIPNNRYLDNGWHNYIDACDNTLKGENARKKENEKWWSQ